jgi:hypothetical protein
VTFVLGFITSVFAEVVRKWLQRPQPVMMFEQERGGIVRPVERVESSSDATQTCYVRIRVYNKSKHFAKSSRPYIARIDRRLADEKNRVNRSWLSLFQSRMRDESYVNVHLDPLPLRWAYVGSNPIDIAGGMSFFFDVLRTDNVQNYFAPCADPLPEFWKQQLAIPGTYKLTIMLSADQIAPVTAALLVKWNGKWDEVSASLIEPGTSGLD